MVYHGKNEFFGRSEERREWPEIEDLMMKMRCEIIKSERLDLWIQKHILLLPYYVSSTRLVMSV